MKIAAYVFISICAGIASMVDFTRGDDSPHKYKKAVGFFMGAIFWPILFPSLILVKFFKFILKTN